MLATHVALIRRGQIAFAGERTQEMLDDTGLAVPHLRGRMSAQAWNRQPRFPRERSAVRGGVCCATILTIAGEGPALGAADQGSAERVARVFDRDPGAVQLRLRSIVGSVAGIFGRLAVGGVFLRGRAGAEPQLRARNAKRLPGRAARLADCRPSALFLGKALANYALLLAVEVGFAAGVRAVLRRALDGDSSGRWCW